MQRTIIWSLVGAAALAAAAWTVVSARPGGSGCNVCLRHSSGQTRAVVELPDGRRQATCCSRCAQHLAENSTGARIVSLTDYQTGQSLPAEQATFVIGSELMPCCAGETQSKRLPQGTCCFKVFDRCLPSVLVFRSRTAAHQIAERHGGEVTNALR